jgi:hypothetical protein
MPIHDWTLVDAGTYHDFHSSWIIHLKEALNGGLLPPDYYAQAEQHSGHFIADILTLRSNGGEHTPSSSTGGLALATAPPKVKRHLSPQAASKVQKKTIAIRHVSGHEVIALIEVVSPANKDRQRHMEQFIDKAESALVQGVHLLIIDLFPAGPHDPQGIPPLLWDRFDDKPYPYTKDSARTLSSYLADNSPQFYVEPVVLRDRLVSMPLFLNADEYINLPLEETYEQSFRGIPQVHQQALQ